MKMFEFELLILLLNNNNNNTQQEINQTTSCFEMFHKLPFMLIIRLLILCEDLSKQNSTKTKLIKILMTLIFQIKLNTCQNKGIKQLFSINNTN